MSVYVDTLISWGTTKGWPYNEACHMFADTLEELHAMADKIGLKRTWFQNIKRLPHYDLTRRRRAAAVRAGAIEVDRRFVAAFMQRQGRQVK